VIGQKDIPVKINNNNSYIETIIKNVFYIPKFNTNLISSKELINKNWEIIFKTNKTIIIHPELGLDIIVNWETKTYYLNILINFNILENLIYSASINEDSSNKYSKVILDLIHKKINYLNKNLLIKTINNFKKFNIKFKNQTLNYYNFC
jgi:hypothetical protein